MWFLRELSRQRSRDPERRRGIRGTTGVAHESSVDHGARIRPRPSAWRLPPSRLLRNPDLRFDMRHRCTARPHHPPPGVGTHRRSRTAIEPKRPRQPLDPARQVSWRRHPGARSQYTHCTAGKRDQQAHARVRRVRSTLCAGPYHERGWTRISVAERTDLTERDGWLPPPLAMVLYTCFAR